MPSPATIAGATEGKAWARLLEDYAPALPEGSALVYGHTHIKVNEESAAHPGLWLFNPGSVSIPKDGTHSYGIYEGGAFRHVILEEE